MEQQYADDVSWITKSFVVKEELKALYQILWQIIEANLNAYKTEEYSIGRTSHQS